MLGDFAVAFHAPCPFILRPHATREVAPSAVVHTSENAGPCLCAEVDETLAEFDPSASDLRFGGNDVVCCGHSVAGVDFKPEVSGDAMNLSRREAVRVERNDLNRLESHFLELLKAREIFVEKCFTKKQGVDSEFHIQDWVVDWLKPASWMRNPK